MDVKTEVYTLLEIFVKLPLHLMEVFFSNIY